MKRKILVMVCCLVLMLTGCRTGGNDIGEKGIPGVDMTDENPLDLRKIHIKRYGCIRTPSTDFLPHTYDMEMEIIKEVNKILEEKINTIIDIEYIPVSMFNTGEILKKLYSNDNVDVIDYMPRELESYIQDLNIADLTDILPIYYPELFEPGIDLNDISTNGRIYKFPVITASAFLDRICLIIEREFYESAGHPSVKTIEDVIALYDYGTEHENKEGVTYLDGNANRYFLCPTPYFLQAYLQGKGYTLLSNVGLYAEKDDKIIDLLETDRMESLYSSLAYMYNKNALSDKNYMYGGWLPVFTDKIPGISMCLVSSGDVTHFPMITNPDEFNRLYKIMYIGGFEPYSYKTLNTRMIICDNGNADRSVIALRLLYHDKELNRLLSYGIEDKHYKFVDGSIEEIWHESVRAYNWWPSIMNKQHFMPMIYSPEGSEKYMQDLYEKPKQVISGVNNGELRFSSGLVKDDKQLYDAMLQREEMYWTVFSYEEALSKGITYDDIVSKMDKEEQSALYDYIKDYVNGLKIK
ncbi:MAG TPA: hypothetical protein DDZ89_00770 [Clostridiales bacterium]|nr:hypothetical protein [Clostridiales bacterium]